MAKVIITYEEMAQVIILFRTYQAGLVIIGRQVNNRSVAR